MGKKNNKLAKSGGSKKTSKSVSKGSTGGGALKLGGTGHLLLEHAGSIGIGVVTKNMGAVNLPLVGKVRPDEALAGLAAVTALVTKGKRRQLALTGLSAAAHAIEGRMVWGGDDAKLDLGKVKTSGDAKPSEDEARRIEIIAAKMAEAMGEKISATIQEAINGARRASRTEGDEAEVIDVEPEARAAS